MTLAATADDARSLDAFLGGRIEALQPRAGHHRAGLEAVLLGAALQADFAGHAVDLGAGAGVAGFCLAARAPSATVTLIEREPDLIECARQALERPANRGIARRVTPQQADIASGALPEASADAVIMNPPFHQAGAVTSPAGGERKRAHLLEGEGLDRWFRAATAILRPGGRLIGIFRADAIAEVMAGAARRFGAIDLLPIQARAGLAAHRLLIRGRKGSRARPNLLPPLVLHGPAGSAFLPEIDWLLRDGAGLAEIFPAWADRTRRGGEANDAAP